MAKTGGIGDRVSARTSAGEHQGLGLHFVILEVVAPWAIDPCTVETMSRDGRGSGNHATKPPGPPEIGLYAPGGPG